MGGWARWTTLIEPAGDGCVVRVALEYELPGELVGSLFGMLTGGRIERELGRTYDRLKRIAEAEARGERLPTADPTDGSADETLEEAAVR